MRGFSLSICSVLLFSLPSTAATYLVGPDGTGDYPTIQVAIDAAADGDTIRLGSGTFSGDGNRDIDYLGKAICVASVAGHPDSCIVDCEGTEADQHRGFHFRSAEDSLSVLRGVTVTNGVRIGDTDFDGGGLRLDGCSPTIQDCAFSANLARDGGGVFCDASSARFVRCRFVDNVAERQGGGVQTYQDCTPVFIDCLFSGNSAIYPEGTGVGGGIDSKLYSGPMLVGCTFYGNDADEGGGIHCHSSSQVIVENTIIAFGGQGGAVRCEGTGGVALSCSDVYGNEGGDWAGCIAGQLGLNGNISADPMFCNAESGDFRIYTSSPCAPYSPPNEECDLIGAGCVGCAPQSCVVLPDGTGDYPTIQAAIDAAEDGDTIMLGSGTFFGEGNRDIDYLGKAIIVQSQSGNPDSCTIHCLYEGRGFQFLSDEDTTSVLAGITITGGYTIYPGTGGAIYCNDGSPLIRDCVFLDNVVGFMGGAVYSHSSAPVFHDCVFRSNQSFGEGGAIYQSGGGTLIGCEFTRNEADDDGGACFGGGTIIDCEFNENTAGDNGGACFGGDTIIDCEFNDNTAGDNGGAIHFGSGTVRGCVFTADTCGIRGGAIYQEGTAAAIIEGCRFKGNHAGQDGGALRCYDVDLVDCIFEANSCAEDGGAVYTVLLQSIACSAFSSNAADVGGAVHVCGHTAGSIDSTVFSENTAQTNGGGLYVKDFDGEIRDCTFWDNTATSTSSSHGGGAIYMDSSSPEIRRCTLVGNASTQRGGGIYLYSSHPEIRNTIVAFGPDGKAVECYGPSASTVSCTDIYANSEGDWTGCIADQLGLAGNISEDPLFCDVEGGDFTLHSDSPCAPFSPPNEECDLTGAWPVGCEAATVPDEEVARFLLRQVAPNPFRETARISLLAPQHGTQARLEIVDVSGRVVSTLTNGHLCPGWHELAWNGRDEAGNPAPGGMYFCRLTSGGETVGRRVLLVR